MVRVEIVPLSVNRAYQGRRFSTPELKKYKDDLFRLLPKMDVPQGILAVRYIFGFSSKASDLDNCIKALQDTISEAYGFNDRMIYKLTAEKRIVPKGSEFVEFDLSPYAI